MFGENAPAKRSAAGATCDACVASEKACVRGRCLPFVYLFDRNGYPQPLKKRLSRKLVLTVADCWSSLVGTLYACHACMPRMQQPLSHEIHLPRSHPHRTLLVTRAHRSHALNAGVVLLCNSRFVV